MSKIPLTEPIYKYHACQQGGWRFLFTPNSDHGSGWTIDDIAFTVPLKTDENSVPIYVFGYNQCKSYGGWRFYYGKQIKPEPGWKMIKVAFYAYSEPINNSIPVYRFYCQQKDGRRYHYHVTNQPIQQGWKMEKIAFYAYKI